MGGELARRRSPGRACRDPRAHAERVRPWSAIGAVSGLPALVATIAVVVTVASTAAFVTVDSSRSSAASNPSTAPVGHGGAGARLVPGTKGSSPSHRPGALGPPRRSRSPSPPQAVVCASVGSHLAPGSAVHLRASSGSVTATLTGVAGSFFGGSDLGDAHIDVTDGARTVVDQPLKDTAARTGAGAKTGAGAGAGTSPTSVFLASIGSDAEAAGASSTPADVPLCLARFAGSAQPTVLVGLSSGGANCCTEVQMFALPSGASTWKSLDDAVGDTTATVEPAPGGALIVTADDSFAGRFTDLAGSGMPVVLQQVVGDKVVEVTAQHPTFVAADATKWWRAYLERPQDPLGALAAWAADECVLGHQRSAFATLDQLQEQGKLRDAALAQGPSAAGSAPATSSSAAPSAAISTTGTTTVSSPARGEAASNAAGGTTAIAASGSGTGRSEAASAPAGAGVLDWPQGSAYVTALRTFLVDSGFCSAS